MSENLNELDRLVSNLNEQEIINQLGILDLYITERSLSEIKLRIESEEMTPTFERKMRGIMEFKKFLQERLK